MFFCFLLSVSGPGRHARIMRRCGIEHIYGSNLVPTSDSGQSSPRLWVTNPHSLSLTRRSNKHANDKGWMNRYICNTNRQRAKDRHGGTNYTEWDSQLPRLWHEGPSYYIPEHPKMPLSRSVRLRYCVWVCTPVIFPSERFLGFRNCGLELVTLNMVNTEVSCSKPLARAGTTGEGLGGG